MQVPIPREKLSYSTRNECFPSTPSPVPHSQYCECAYLSGPFIFIFLKKNQVICMYNDSKTSILDVSL